MDSITTALEAFFNFIEQQGFVVVDRGEGRREFQNNSGGSVISLTVLWETHVPVCRLESIAVFAQKPGQEEVSFQVELKANRRVWAATLAELTRTEDPVRSTEPFPQYGPSLATRLAYGIP